MSQAKQTELSFKNVLIGQTFKHAPIVLTTAPYKNLKFGSFGLH
jgi:hypothetical protein